MLNAADAMPKGGSLSVTARDCFEPENTGKLTDPEVTQVGVEIFALCEKKETSTDDATKKQIQTEKFSEQFQVNSARLLKTLRSGAIRPLAVASARRSAILPELPTVAESGVAGYEAASWNGLAAPARTPAAVIERLNREVNSAIAAPEVARRFHDLGIEPRAGTPQALRRQLVSDIAKWKAVIERAKILPQ
jgi:tripartite-type tricarboxylate transporter receptor subunit TctC